MKYVVFIDGGHGLKTPGKRTDYVKSLGRQIKENEFNDAVVKKIIPLLEAQGIFVHDVAPGRSDVSLQKRTDKANILHNGYVRKYGSNNVKTIYVSIHYDANTGKFSTNSASGHSIYYYPNSAIGKKLATCIYNELKKGTLQKDRGVREADYHVLRETVMPAVLSENGFMDDEREAKLMVNPTFQNEVAKEHVKGICKYFGITYKEKVSHKQKYHVVESGDTLFKISEQYKVSVDVIKKLNKLSSDTIKVGQKLKV